jgi:hypothetical protein
MFLATSYTMKPISIQSLYNEVKCTVRVNNDLTPWFNVEAGVKQGCILFPTLFSIYINDFGSFK